MSQHDTPHLRGHQPHLIHVARGMYMHREDVDRIRAENERLREQEEADARDAEEVERWGRMWLANEASMDD